MDKGVYRLIRCFPACRLSEASTLHRRVRRESWSRRGRRFSVCGPLPPRTNFTTFPFLNCFRSFPFGASPSFAATCCTAYTILEPLPALRLCRVFLFVLAPLPALYRPPIRQSPRDHSEITRHHASSRALRMRRLCISLCSAQVYLRPIASGCSIDRRRS